MGSRRLATLALAFRTRPIGPDEAKSPQNSNNRPLEDFRQPAPYFVGTRRFSYASCGVASATCFSLGMDSFCSRYHCNSRALAILHGAQPASKRDFPAEPYSRSVRRPGARGVTDWLVFYIFGVPGVADGWRDSADPRSPVYHS